MKISEIFYSISGESIQAGRPAIFVRTYGCPLRCSYCDSMYSVCEGEYRDMSVNDIMYELKKYKCKYVVFTGGEPLIQDDSRDLIFRLISENYHVEIETCGAVDISDVSGLVGVTITMDWKCPSSNMTSRMMSENLKLLDKKDVLKCVVGSEEDLDEMKRVSKLTDAQLFVSPVFGEIEPAEIVDYILKHQLNNVRFQLQVHKYVWDKDKRGV